MDQITTGTIVRGPSIAQIRRMARSVTTFHRYKRPPKERAQALTGPAIVTTRAKRGRFGEAPDLTDEKYRRGGDAEELFRELVRRVTGSALHGYVANLLWDDQFDAGGLDASVSRTRS